MTPSPCWCALSSRRPSNSSVTQPRIVLTPACYWIYYNTIETKHLAVMSLIPPTISLIPGTLGEVVLAVVGIVPWVIDWAVTWLLNL